MNTDAEKVKDFVRRRYGSLARRGNNCCCPGVSSRLYTTQELKGLPETATGFSLGCGNPVALAELKAGEVVLDLGSGGGLDCLLAARQVGEGGRVIGLDMSPEMVDLARENARRAGVGNVEFRLGEMEAMPVDTGSVDVIISNCVINLSPDKDLVFREAFRVLKPGGRLSISDIVLLGELPAEERESLEAWAGCMAGALPREEYLGKLERAGFVGLRTREEPRGLKSLPLASLWVEAYKPV